MTHDKKATLEHPSFAMIGFQRGTHSSTTRLFGSALKSHYSTIRMTVKRAYWEHDLHEDRYYTAGQPRLIEVEMSAAQFAEAITAMNVGDGVPCTLRFFEGHVDDPPDIETEVERVKNNFGTDLKDMIGTMQKYRKEIEKLTEKLPEKSRERLRVALDVMIQQLSSNVPFILEQFNEASDRVVTSAKHDIEAFAMHALRAAGLTALAEGKTPKQLAAALDAEKQRCGECDGEITAEDDHRACADAGAAWADAHKEP
jgi:hypothetical protein